MISLINDDSSEGEQWGRYNLSGNMFIDDIHDGWIAANSFEL